MRVEKGTVRAPEIGRVWLNSPPYLLVKNNEFGEHELELVCTPWVAAFAFTFTGCAEPVAGALHASTGSKS